MNDLDLSELDAPPIGHNSGDLPPVIDLDDATLAAQERARRHAAIYGERLAGFERWKAATAAGIQDDTLQGRSADFFKQLGETVKLIDGDREATKSPVLALGRLIDAEYKGFIEPLNAARGAIERVMTTYARQKAEKERAAARARAEEEARLQHEAAELAAAEAELNGEDAPPAPLPTPVEAALPSQAEASRVHGDYGTTASLRGRWTYEVEDAALIPRHLLMVNDAAVKAAIKAGERKIPGVRVFQETKIGVR